jgi:hypothetical protein
MKEYSTHFNDRCSVESVELCFERIKVRVFRDAGLRNYNGFPASSGEYRPVKIRVYPNKAMDREGKDAFQ